MMSNFKKKKTYLKHFHYPSFSIRFASLPMDTSRPPTSAEEQQPQKTRMTSNPHANQYAYQENAYHQKPPSFNHKHVNISLVDDGNNTKKQQKNKEKQQQAGAGEWRESIPIKLEHLLFNFKENSLK